MESRFLALVGYTTSMPKLTEEQLARLYPTAKTYDEVQAKHAIRNEIRRPTFLILKVGFQTALGVAITLTTYHLLSRLITTTSFASMGGTMTTVCGVILAGIILVAILYYLYSLTNALLSVTYVNPTLPMGLITSIFFLAIVVFWFLLQANYNHIAISALLVVTTFILACCVVTISPKQ